MPGATVRLRINLSIIANRYNEEGGADTMTILCHHPLPDPHLLQLCFMHSAARAVITRYPAITMLQCGCDWEVGGVGGVLIMMTITRELS